MTSCKTATKIQPIKMRGLIDNMQYPAIAEVKYDGELNKVIYDKGKWSTINKYGLTRLDWNKQWPEIDCDYAEFYGELMYQNGFAGDLYKLLSHKNDESKLELKLFDIIQVDAQGIAGNHLIERKETLVTLLRERLEMIGEFTVIEDEKEAWKYFYAQRDRGYEGIVVKAMHAGFTNNNPWVKLKSKDQSEYQIVEIDPVKERMEVRVAVSNPDGSILERNVGVKLDNSKKSSVAVGDMVIIEHQGILSGGGLRHPVFIGKAGDEENG